MLGGRQYLMVCVMCLIVSKQMLEQVLRELQPLCIAEQRFIEKFFMLSQDAADQEEPGVSQLSEPLILPSES